MRLYFFFLFRLSCLLLLFPLFSFGQKTDHLDMKMWFKDSTVKIQATYLTHPTSPTDSFYFLINPGFQQLKIEAEGLSGFRMAPKPGRPFPFRLLKFDQQLNPGEPVEIVFVYSINLATQNHMRAGWIELNADKLWFPNCHDMNNRFTYTVTATGLPKGYDFVSHSDAFLERKEEKLHINKKEPWYEVLLLGGHAMEHRAFDEKISFFAGKTFPDSTFQKMGTIVRNTIDHLNNLFGKSYPIDDFQVVIRNASRKEIGYQVNRQNLIITGAEFDDYGNLSHEIAHFWWNKANFIQEPWMNESFANYSMFRILRKFEPLEYDKLLQRTQKIAEASHPPVTVTQFEKDSYDAFYHKGSIRLIDLEERIGVDQMDQLLAACIEHSIHTTEGFLRELEARTDPETRKYFEELLKK